MPKMTPANQAISNFPARKEANRLLDKKNSGQHIPQSNDKIANQVWQEIATWLEKNRTLSLQERRAEILKRFAAQKPSVDMILELAASTLLKFDDAWNVLERGNTLGLLTDMGYNTLKASQRNARKKRKGGKVDLRKKVCAVMKRARNAHDISFKDFLKNMLEKHYKKLLVTQKEIPSVNKQGVEQTTLAYTIVVDGEAGALKNIPYRTLEDWFSNCIKPKKRS